ncbi:MAG TPA: PTS fructose transporter subunit IIA [Acidobacteriota bacterium]|nr:PTS fructose transporter subunit IIA [bacterium]HNX20418.1 PTS fructose transporter subunit IIA [Acidobacteriota bacterium]
MIGLLVVTHGGLAAELVAAARRIVAQPGAIAGLAIDWDSDVGDSRRKIQESLEALDQGDGVIIATDMFGGTPTNVALTFLEPGKVEVVTGVNLPMVIKFTNLREQKDLAETARMLAARGRGAITVAGEILAGKQEG